MKKAKKHIFLLSFILALIGGLYAQTEFPAGDFWSLDAGIGMTEFVVEGIPVQIILDPKIWLSPPLMVGSRMGVNYSTETEHDLDLSDILTLESQVYLRWNFLRLGRHHEKTTNFFIQGGLGLEATYRGRNNPFDDKTETRGSLLADAALGVTIPLSARWHIEPSVRVGYPHIFGVSLTAGYKFPRPKKIKYLNRTEYVEMLRTEYVETLKTEYIETVRTEYVEMIKWLPREEIIKRVMISSIEYVLFGPDIGRYNTGIDNDAQGLNELALNSTAKLLKENHDFLVRIEGHANPVTTDPKEADELMALGTMRANAVADQLKRRGVSDDQMVIVSFGGTRTVTSDHDIWNRNRRVELIIVQIDTNTN